MYTKAQPKKWLRFCVYISGFLLNTSLSFAASCPPDARLDIERTHTEKIHLRDLAVDTGAHHMKFNLRWPGGTLPAPLALTGDGLQTRYAIELFPERPLWRLSIPRQEGSAEVVQVTANYTLIAGDGGQDGLSLSTGAVSVFPAKLVAQPVTHKRLETESVFEGRVRLEVDLASASAAGNYRAMIQVSLDCEYAQFDKHRQKF